MHNQRRSRRQFRTPLAGLGQTAVPRVLPRRAGRSPALAPPPRRTRRGRFWAVNPTADSTSSLPLVLSYETEIAVQMSHDSQVDLVLHG
jgi:hypothetical protein